MVVKEYRQNKERVLLVFNEYVELCQKMGEEPKQSLVKQAEKIRDEIFNLMIVGEAKSGKSTFINAYLGNEVLPMDARQCTSAIIKIKQGNKFELVATTAARGKTVVNGDQEIREFLRIHAAIPDKYRSIPITAINNEILIKYKGQKVPNKILDKFLEEELKDNIYSIDENEYKELIKSYISENASQWGKIITEIEITYQLSDEMKGITVIDSPGIGAVGSVGKIAEKYIEEANAIIFVKTLYGQALESIRFMNFFKNNCAQRKRDALFLVFTGKANLQGSEFNKLREQALEMYGKYIEPEKIIYIDSKIQLFLNRSIALGTVEAIDKYFKELEDQEDEYDPASSCWLKARGDINNFEERMMEKSDFDSFQRIINRFAHNANYIQLIEFLENLEKEYERKLTIYEELLKTAQQHINDPEALADSIKNKQIEIADVYNKLNDVINRIYRDYTDNINGEGIIMNEADKKQREYVKKLENFRRLSEEQISDSTFSALKRMTMDAIDDTKMFRREMANRIISECNEKLIQYTDDPDSIPATAYNPNFTETDFDEINSRAQKETVGYKDIEEGRTFKKTERVPYHNLREHVKLVANSIYRRLDSEIIPRMKDNVIAYVTKCTEEYQKKLLEHKNELEKEYNKLLKDQKDNEDAKKMVEKLEKKYSAVKDGITTIEQLREELNNYVNH